MADPWAVVSQEPAGDPWTVVEAVPTDGRPSVGARQRTLGERFADNFGDALKRGTTTGASAGALAAYAGGRIDKARVNPEMAPLDVRGINREDADQYRTISEADPFYRSRHPVLAGAATLAGQLAGSLPAVETWLSPGGSLTRRLLASGAINAAADVPTQALSQAAGAQDQYDPVRTAAAAGLGVTIPAAVHVGGKLLAPLAERAANLLKKAREKAPAPERPAGPAPAPPDEWAVVDRQPATVERPKAPPQAPNEEPAVELPPEGESTWTPEREARWQEEVNGRPADIVDDSGGWTVISHERAEERDRANPHHIADIEDAKTKVASLIGKGVTFTSDIRTPEHNAKVGGAKNSNHLTGHALDFVPPKGVSMAEAHRILTASGIPFHELINEGDHIHIAWRGKGERSAGEAAAIGSAEAEVRKAMEALDRGERTTMTSVGAEPSGRAETEARIAEAMNGRGQATTTRVDESADWAPRPPPDEPNAAPDLTDKALDALRTGKGLVPDRGPTLAEFIAGEGGIADPGGELKGMDAELWRTFKKTKGNPFQPRLVNPRGLSLEEAAQRAHDAGYFPEIAAPRMDSADNMQAIDGPALLDAIREELAGKRRYAREPDPAEHEIANYAAELDQILGEVGLSVAHASNAEIKKALTDFFRQPNTAGAGEESVLGLRHGQRRGSVVSSADAPAGPSDRGRPDRGAARRPGGLLGSGPDRPEPAFLDRAHADLYRLGQSAAAGKPNLAEAERLAGSMGRFMDWTDVPDTAAKPWTDRERADLRNGRIPPRRMVEAAQDFLHDVHDRAGSVVSYYDPDRYHEVMSAHAGPPPASEKVRLADGPAEQGLIPGIEPVSDMRRMIAERIKQKEARRGSAPPAEGSLFDDTPKTGDLFGMFAGGKARTADKGALATAKAMDKAGEGREAIRAATGWIKGDEGKWRFEISDHGAALREGAVGGKGVGLARLEELAENHGVARLDSIIDHPTLFEAYPQLRALQVVVEDMENWAETRLDLPGGPELAISARALGLDGEELRGVIIHEVQHLVQDREGFDFGITAERAGDEDYWRSAGEVEARNTQRRRLMDDDTRRTVAPDRTRDVPREDTIAGGGDGRMAEAPGDDPLASRNMTLVGRPRLGAVPAEGKTGRAAYPGENVSQMAARLNRALGLTARQGRMSLKKALGQYSRDTGVIRMKKALEINTLAHEGGHALEFRDTPAIKAVLKKHAKDLKPLAYEGADPRSLRQEGFAEFFRLYITKPAGAREALPSFYDDFEAALERDMPKVLAELRDIQTAYQEFLAAPSTGVVAANIVRQRKPGPAKRYLDTAKFDDTPTAFKQFTDDAFTAAVDRFHPLHQAVGALRRIGAENGKPIGDLPTTKNPYRLARMVQGSHAAALMDIKSGVRGYRQVDAEGPSLQEALVKALGNDWSDVAIEDFGAYLVSRRMVQEWHRYNAGKLQREPDSLPRVTHEQNIKDMEAAHPAWPEAAQMVYGWTERLWKKRYDAGLIGEGTYRRGLEEHLDYVPVMRDLSDRDRVPGKATGRGGKFAGGVAQFKGSNRPVINPIQSLMQSAFELNGTIARNDVIKALDDLGQAAGRHAGAIVERIPAKQTEAITVAINDAVDSAAKTAGLSWLDQENLRASLEEALGPNAEGTVYRRVTINEKGEPIVFAWRDGERVALRLPDGEFGKQLYDTLSTLTKDQKNVFVDAMAAVATAQRAGITTAPAFLVRNFFRDQFSAWMLTDVGYKPFASSVRGMVDELGQRKIAREYSHMGGLMGGANVSALSPAMDLRPQAIRPMRASWGGLTRAIIHASELSETGTRLGIYRNAKRRASKAGLSDYDAAMEGVYESRDYFDTGLNGASNEAKIAKRLLPFFNANIQGLRKALSVGTAEGNFHRMLAPFGANAPKTPVEKAAFRKAYKFWAKMVAVGVIGGSITALNMGDPEFREFDDRERATHWFIKTKGGWIRLPKPFELAAFSDIFERGLELYVQKDPTAPQRLAKDLAETIIPPMQTPAVSIPWELGTNKDYAGRPIVPEGVKGKVDPAQQYNAYTSTAGRKIGETLNVSPAAVDHIIGGFFGTWGRDAEKFSDALAGRRKASLGREDVPVISAFTSAPERGTDSAAHFWKLMSADGGKLQEREGSFRAAIKAGQFDKALAYLNRLDPVEKDFVLSQVFSEKGSSKLNPLERARLASGVIGSIRRDLTSGAPVRTLTGEELALGKDQVRDADKALATLQMVELSNGMKQAGVKGWSQRQLMSRREAMQTLDAIDPDLLAVLDLRMQSEKVPSPAIATQAWPHLRQALHGLSDRQLRALMSEERIQSSSTKLDEKLRRRALTPAGAL